MRRLILLALLLLPLPALGQQIIQIPPQQCVFRTGDSPSWAVADLDETGWRPYADWKYQPGQPSLWVRCHANLDALRAAVHPAIQVNVTSAYQLYLNGDFIGGEGDMRRGEFSIDSIRLYPAIAAKLTSGPSTIAIRMNSRGRAAAIGRITQLIWSPFATLRAGEEQTLQAVRAQSALARIYGSLEPALCYGVVSVLAFVLLGLFVYDRSRRDFLLLSIACLSLAALRINELCAAAYLPYSISACLAIVLTFNIALVFTQTAFFFALANRRMNTLFRILVAGTALGYLPSAIDVLLAAHRPVWLDVLSNRLFRPYHIVIHIAVSFAPFLAFGPWRRIAPRMRPLAALCMVWAAEDLTWFAVELTGIPIPGVPDLFQTWGSTLLEARGLTSACVLAALLALLFRDQRQVSNERAQLAGELDAARMIQQRLVPIELPAVTGLRIAAAYLPAAEVGGDFYQIFEQPDGASLIIVGDVSGKGLKAAMTGALAIGALRALAEEAICPAELLRRLNRQVLSAQDNSFITCLCARIARDGSLVLANAGHLAPYCNGDEVELESGLPLGIVPDVDFIETALQLAPGDTLTLLSDGVVEAMNEERELFGFERTRAISRQTARSIADAAQQFGQPQPQNDDITVLTLTFAPAEMVYA